MNRYLATLVTCFLGCAACRGPDLNLGDSDLERGGGANTIPPPNDTAGAGSGGFAGDVSAIPTTNTNGGQASAGQSGSGGAPITPLPLPTLEQIPYNGDDVFGSVYVAEDGTIWAGSSSVQRYADGSWADYAETTGETICDMWGDGTRPIYASGQRSVYQYTGAWGEVGSLDCTLSLRLSVTDNFVYAACPEETDGVLRISRSAIPEAERAPASLAASRTLWAFSDAYVEALVASNDSLGRPGYLRVFRGGVWNTDASWNAQQIERSRAEPLNAMWSSDGKSLLIVGDGGSALRRSALGEWHEDETGSSSVLNDVWGTPSDGDFAVGDDGTVLFFDRVKWHKLASPVSARLKAVHGQPDGTIAIVGEQGSVLRVVR